MNIKRSLSCGGSSRVPAIFLVCLGALGIAAALVYRRISIERSFRDAPAETLSRPIIEGPGKEPSREEESDPRFEPMKPTPVTSTNSSGAIVWEAEWVNSISGSLECMPGKDTGDGMAVWALEGTGRNNGSYFRPDVHMSRGMGMVRYTFGVSESGRYRLWMRIWAMDKCGNSCWVGFDDEGFDYFPGGWTGPHGGHNYHWPESMYKRWLWIEHGDFTHYFDEGEHTMRIAVREDGMGIDQIALVPAGSPEPAGIIDADHMTAEEEKTNISPWRVSIGFEDRCVPDGTGTVSGTLVLRLNSQSPRECDVTLSCQDAEILPGASTRASLSADSPIQFRPFELGLSGLKPGQWRKVKASVADNRAPGMGAAWETEVFRPLVWWTLPFDYSYQSYRVFQSFYGVRQIDTTIEASVGTRKMQWRKSASPHSFDPFGVLDFVRVYGERSRGTVIAATRIQVKKSGTYTLAVSADDSLHLLLDGKTLLTREEAGPVTDRIDEHSIELEEGIHLLVAKVAQYGGAWQLLLRCSDKDGDPTDDIVGLDELK